MNIRFGAIIPFLKQPSETDARVRQRAEQYMESVVGASGEACDTSATLLQTEPDLPSDLFKKVDRSLACGKPEDFPTLLLTGEHHDIWIRFSQGQKEYAEAKTVRGLLGVTHGKEELPPAIAAAMDAAAEDTAPLSNLANPQDL